MLAIRSRYGIDAAQEKEMDAEAPASRNFDDRARRFFNLTLPYARSFPNIAFAQLTRELKPYWRLSHARRILEIVPVSSGRNSAAKE